MEFWDVYDAQRNLLGRKHKRGTPMRRGEYHLAVFVWVFNNEGKVLLTKRSPEKRSYPNLWALTGGAVLAGESSLAAVQRELFEETGIHARREEFTLVDTYLRKDCFCDIYFLKKDVPLSQMVMQPGETCDCRWVSRAEFEQMRYRKEIANPDAKRYLQLGEKLKDFLK